MAALDTIGIDWKLLVAQLVNFFILLFILYKFAYRPILAMLEKRSKTIAKSLEDAKAIEQNRAASDADRERLLMSAQRDAEHIVTEARARAEELRESLLAKTKEEASHVLALAHREADAAKANVVREAQMELADLIVTASGKVIGKKLTDEGDERLVATALKEVQK